MPDIGELIKRPEFYFKLIELALCIAGTIMYVACLQNYLLDNRSTEIALSVAMPNSIITTAVLLILVVMEAQHRITELCLNGTEAILNLVLGIIIIAGMSSNSPASHLVLACLMIACGVVMILDCVRELRN